MRAREASSGASPARLATEALPDGGDAPVPLELRAEIGSDEGRTDVRGASGSVAGVPAGPLAELVVGALIDRSETAGQPRSSAPAQPRSSATRNSLRSSPPV